MYAAITVMCIVIPVCLTAVGSAGTDIVGDICALAGVYSSQVVKKTLSLTAAFITYLFPLTAMILCYSRVVCTLKHKVTTTI